MKFVFLFLVLGAAFVLETFLTSVVGRFEMVPPLVVGVMVVGFFFLNPAERLWTSIVFGFLGDVIFSFSFGTHVVGFLLLAVLVEVFNRIFLGNSHDNYYLTRALGAGVMIFIFLNMIVPLSSLLAWVRIGYGALDAFPSNLFNVLAYSILWSAVMAAVTFVILCYSGKIRGAAGAFRL